MNRANIFKLIHTYNDMYGTYSQLYISFTVKATNIWNIYFSWDIFFKKGCFEKCT